MKTGWLTENFSEGRSHSVKGNNNCSQSVEARRCIQTRHIIQSVGLTDRIVHR